MKIEPWIEELFPFFVACDREGRVARVGRSLRKLLGAATDAVSVEVLHPSGARTLDAVCDGNPVIVRVGAVVSLRGVARAEPWGAVFLGTLHVSEPAEYAAMGLDAEDFAPFDQTVEHQRLLARAEVESIGLAQCEDELHESRALTATLVEKVSEAKEQAAHALRTRDRFLAMMSHELRTPLSTILTTNQIMLLGELNASQREHALAQQRAGGNLLALINSVLDLSKLQEGRFDLVPEVFDPRGAIDEVVDSLRDEGERKGLLIEWFASPKVPAALRGDPVRFRQMLTNYLANALKFTERGGVLVAMTIEQIDDVRCEVLVRVRDSGIGLDAATLEGLFKPFVQAHRDRGSGYVGTGLGLSICKQIAELMGGEAGAYSAIDKGSTFWFRVWMELDTTQRGRRTNSTRALTLPAPPTSTSTSTTESSKRPRPRILVVDDDAVNRHLLMLLVQTMGYAVDVASNGAAALESVQSARYGAVMMDCSMPGMDGFEATRAIRALPEPMCETPVIACTAHALEGDRERCLNEGMDDYVAKPFNMVQVRDVLARWVPTVEIPELPNERIAMRIAMSSPAGSSRSSVDFTVLRALRAYQQEGEPDLLREVVELFEQDARSRAAQLVAAIEAKDAEAIRLHAHSLKGASSNVGARKIERLARWIERVDAFADPDFTLEVALALRVEVESAVLILRSL